MLLRSRQFLPTIFSFNLIHVSILNLHILVHVSSFAAEFIWALKISISWDILHSMTCHLNPGWGPRRKQVCPDRRWTHEGGVVRSKLHSLETSKNARKSEHERTKVCRTHESLDMNARKSEHERTKVWRTHESLDIGNFRLGRSGHSYFPSGTVWTYLLPSGTSAWELISTNEEHSKASIFFGMSQFV